MSATWERVKESLVAAGLMDERGNSRRACARACQRCGAKTVVGYDADRVAILAVADPTPLTAIGEVLAIVAGRQTWTLEDRGRLELNYRDAWRIRAHPAEERPSAVVLAEHRCGDNTLEPFVASNDRLVARPDFTGAPPY